MDGQQWVGNGLILETDGIHIVCNDESNFFASPQGTLEDGLGFVLDEFELGLHYPKELFEAGFEFVLKGFELDIEVVNSGGVE